MGKSKNEFIELSQMDIKSLERKIKLQNEVIKELKAQIEAIKEYYELDESDLERFTDGLDGDCGCGHDGCSQNDTSLYRQLTDE